MRGPIGTGSVSSRRRPSWEVRALRSAATHSAPGRPAVAARPGGVPAASPTAAPADALGTLESLDRCVFLFVSGF